MSGVFRKLSLQVKPGNSRKNHGREHEESNSSSDSGDPSPASAGKSEGPSRSSTSGSAKHAQEVAAQADNVQARRSNTFKHAGQEIVSMPRSLAGKFHLPGRSSPSRSSTDLPKNREGEDMSKNQVRKQEKQSEKEEKASWQEKQTAELQKRREEQMHAADVNDTPEMREKYGWAPINNYSGSW